MLILGYQSLLVVCGRSEIERRKRRKENQQKPQKNKNKKRNKQKKTHINNNKPETAAFKFLTKSNSYPSIPVVSTSSQGKRHVVSSL
jgi:hypothetical protein